MNTCYADGCTRVRKGEGRSLCSTCHSKIHPRTPRLVPRLPVEPLARYFELNKSVVRLERWQDLRELFENNRDSGLLVFVADRVLVKDFGVHPSVVYGQDWWAA